MSLGLTKEQSASLLCSESGSSVDGHGASALNSPKQSKTRLSAQTCLTVLLAMSNIFFLMVALHPKSEKIPDNRSPYGEAKLTTNLSDTLHWTTAYSGENSTLVDALWETEIPWETGIIALTKSEASHMGLPESQPFPWDPLEKSIYIVNAHHILHCVRNLYISIREYRHSLPQSVSYPHILHCLDTIRVETMCAADDTPRYVPANGAHGYRPGDGQTRQCRDWSQLEAFVRRHDPCYRYVCPGNEHISNLERFKYCQDDSVYLPKIRKYFGLEQDWVPSREDVDAIPTVEHSSNRIAKRGPFMRFQPPIFPAQYIQLAPSTNFQPHVQQDSDLEAAVEWLHDIVYFDAAFSLGIRQSNGSGHGDGGNECEESETEELHAE
ncbi:hypothetical protein BDV10DRAFT_184230 [Aspergillus recurvatus]